jgi:putative ABC transport system permease protein
MFKNYISVALRNLKKHKAFSFINIFGLSVGLSCCMLISLYIHHEYSYDQHHEKGDRLYQLGVIFDTQGEAEPFATVPAALAGALQQEFPEIEERARLLGLFEDDKTLLQYQEPGGNIKPFYETKGYLADAEFFRLFSYDFIEGNPATALENPNTVVLTEEIAQKLFGSQPALGKTIRISSSTNGDYDYTITGVFRPKSTPSHIDARFFMSSRGGGLEDFFHAHRTLVKNNMFHTYFLLKDGIHPQGLEQKFPAFVDQHMREELEEISTQRALFLTALEDVHLDPRLSDNITPPSSLTYIRILASIALLTLLIACINFMNLSTARSAKRSIEVGVRKVLGAEKSALIRQFLGESLIMALLAFIFAVMFVWLLLPLFEQLSGKALSLSFAQHGLLLMAFVLLAIATGIMAGSYPAFFLSSFKPVRVLKGRFSNSLSATFLRKGLVIFQFVISVVLIIASVIISEQMSFLRSKDLGFIKEQQVVIPLRSAVAKNNYLNLKEKLSRNPAIASVGASYYYPGIFNPIDWLMYKEGQSMQQSKDVHINYVDDTFLQTLGIQKAEGRLFSPEFTADTSNQIILNQKAIEAIGFASAEEAVGNWVALDWEGEQIRFPIIGVVKDFHFKDLHMAIEPYGFMLNNNADQKYLIANIGNENIGGTLAAIKKDWNMLNPNEPLEYSFLDQDFQKNYQAEHQLASMIRYFTMIAIMISCLGLFGLATFSAEQRIKEIGIRKILGASVYNLTSLLSIDFLKLVILAVVLASPLAWYIMQHWLQTFAYRVSIGWQVFALTTGLALLIALATVSFQAIKAAMTNPVKNLRTE